MTPEAHGCGKGWLRATVVLALAVVVAPVMAQTANTKTVTTYDALDRVTQVTDPSGLNTTYQYDGLSNPTSTTSPDTGVTARTFDAAGNVLTGTDAKGITVTYTYDAQDRKLSASYADTTQNITYHYDEPNSTTGCGTSYPIGRLTRIVEASVTTVYCYDAQGDVIQKQQITASGTDTTGYGYTAASRLSGIVYPSGSQASYTRDGDGRIQSISVTPLSGTASTAVSQVTYQPFGPVSGYTLGNGQSIARTYDANYRLTDLVSPAFTLHVARDVMGDITAIGNSPGANPATETYSYDPLYRLTTVTEANGTALEGVTYNQTGDRLTKTGGGLGTGAYGYNPNTHQLVSVGNSALTVDANGNTAAMTQAGSTYGFGYSARNRMTVAQLAGSTVGSYTYNALNERVQKIANGATERYGYNENSQILAEYGATNRDYIWMGGIPVANIDTSGTVSTIAYVTADQLGTPRAVANGVGTIEWQLPYQGNPWGEQVPTSSGYVYNLSFPGQYFDIETSLYYNVNRYYNAPSGRYLQSDLIGLKGGLSTYAYVGGYPLGYSDPLGLNYAQTWGAGGAVVGGVVTAGASVVVDAATGGVNVVATPWEVGGGAALGGGIGYVLGSALDWATGNSPTGNGANGVNAGSLPPGSLPISDTPWSGDHGVIKGALGLGGSDSVYIDPDGNVWALNPDGSWSNEGPASDYTGSGKPSGRRGKDRKQRGCR